MITEFIPDRTGTFTAIWTRVAFIVPVVPVVLAVLVGWAGFGLARRAWQRQDSITEVAAVGLMACLLSPVAWIHHFHWIVVVILALLGADPWRERRRLLAAGLVLGWFLCRLPWWGISWLVNDWPLEPVGRLLQNADTLGALVALWLLARMLGPSPASAGRGPVLARDRVGPS